MCELSEAVVLHPRTKGSFTAIAQEDSWKLLEQSTPGKMENNVDHRDVKETDEVSEPHSKRLLFS